MSEADVDARSAEAVLTAQQREPLVEFDSHHVRVMVALDAVQRRYADAPDPEADHIDVVLAIADELTDPIDGERASAYQQRRNDVFWKILHALRAHFADPEVAARAQQLLEGPVAPS